MEIIDHYNTIPDSLCRALEQMFRSVAKDANAIEDPEIGKAIAEEFEPRLANAGKGTGWGDLGFRKCMSSIYRDYYFMLHMILCILHSLNSLENAYTLSFKHTSVFEKNFYKWFAIPNSFLKENTSPLSAGEMPSYATVVPCTFKDIQPPTFQDLPLKHLQP